MSTNSTYYALGSSQQLNNDVANHARFLPFSLSPATPDLVSSASSPISFHSYNSVNYSYTLLNTSTTTYYFNFSSQFQYAIGYWNCGFSSFA